MDYQQDNVDPELLRAAEALHSKEAELNKREANLDVRAEILLEREKSLGPNRIPNWPPCKPLIYQNIKDDMPNDDLKRLVTFAYIAWLVSLGGLFWNLVVTLSQAIVLGKGYAIADFIVAIIYFVFLPPMWFFIFRILYRASRKRRPSLFIGFFIFYVPTVLTFIFFALGIPSTGSSGLFYMIQLFNDDEAIVGIFALISIVVWGALTAAGIFILFVARIQYSLSGGFEKAKKEMASEAARQAREHPDLVAQGVKAGARAAANNPDLVAKGAKAAYKASG